MNIQNLLEKEDLTKDELVYLYSTRDKDMKLSLEYMQEFIINKLKLTDKLFINMIRKETDTAKLYNMFTKNDLNYLGY